MEERVEAIRDVGGEDEHYQVMHSKSDHTALAHWRCLHTCSTNAYQ